MTRIKILVYCNNYIEETFARKLISLMANLQQYEFILVYCGEERHNLPQNVTSICFLQDAEPYIATYLAMLAELLDVDIYWCNAAYFVQNAISLRYLKDSPVRRIISFHYLEPTAERFTKLCEDDGGKSPLSYASILTHEKQEMMVTPYLYPFNGVYLPSIQADKTTVEQWEMLFHTVLSSDNYMETVMEMFPSARKVDDYDSAEAVAQQIKEYMGKYEKYTLDKIRQYYEHSPYWTITKPLRMISDLCRKLLKRGA